MSDVDANGVAAKSEDAWSADEGYVVQEHNVELPGAFDSFQRCRLNDRSTELVRQQSRKRRDVALERDHFDMGIRSRQLGFDVRETAICIAVVDDRHVVPPASQRTRSSLHIHGIAAEAVWRIEGGNRSNAQWRAHVITSPRAARACPADRCQDRADARASAACPSFARSAWSSASEVSAAVRPSTS